MEILYGCIPGIITGIFLFFFQRRIVKQEKMQEERDVSRNKYIKLIVDLTLATHALSEANAVALQMGQTGKEFDKALEYARNVKYRHRDFLEESGINNIF